MFKVFLPISAILLALSLTVESFPDGAPINMCLSNGNSPKHGRYEAQPLGSMPYQVKASSGSYKPGDTITCEKLNTKFVVILTKFHFSDNFW